VGDRQETLPLLGRWQVAGKVSLAERHLEELRQQRHGLHGIAAALHDKILDALEAFVRGDIAGEGESPLQHLHDGVERAVDRVRRTLRLEALRGLLRGDRPRGAQESRLADPRLAA
jgi:hypothetical protein